MNLRRALYFCTILLTAAACSTTRSLQDGQYLLRKNKIVVNDNSVSSGELGSYVSQKPNSYLLGLNPFLSIYNWGDDGSTPMERFWKKLGEAPVVYDPSQVDKTIASIQNHLRYIGYYGSQVESSVAVKKRKVYVTYYVALGKRYKISSIDYEVPTYGTFKKDFEADLPNSTLAVGQYLSESALEAEAVRSSQYFRNNGYYGFTKTYYAFEADTLASDGQARLKMAIRDYGLGDTPSQGHEHKKFTLNEVTITRPERLKIRPSVLENLNILRPGQLYDERDINTTYSRLAKVNMLSGVNIDLNPVSDDKVDCNISVRGSGLQGFKTNLEVSVNSSGLMGVSPQLTYYHKNIFHGGEVLNLAVKGNFQFKFKDSAYSTEVSASSTIRFPQFLGLPNRIFKGPNIPHTDLSLAFSYQDRPEYKRTVIASALTYNGRLGKRLFYQISPIRANITRIFNMSDEFSERLMSSLYMLQAYSDSFDMGVGGMLYYTTDASAIPKTPYYFFRVNLDVSGNLLSLFNPILPVQADSYLHTIWNVPYSQYARLEFQTGKVFRFGKEDRHAFAMRFWGGVAFPYGNGYMPMERYFSCGGAMSMRGWQARALGPGNDETFREIFSIPSQIGDIKLEANVEYRFPIFWKLEGALFVDAGNIWDFPNPDYIDEGAFTFDSLGESIAMDWGPGIRVNLDFLLLRLDLGFRVHDPAREEGDRWLGPGQWFKKGNLAVHFGVGYPF